MDYYLNDKVLIKDKNIKGTVVDIININGKDIITVESDEKSKNDESNIGGIWKLYECEEKELILIP